MVLGILAAITATFQPAPCDLAGVPDGFERDHRVQCGWVTVPLRADGDQTIRLWIARVKSASPDARSDPIIYINGGPGIDSVDTIVPALATSKTLQAMGRDRDIVIFDQRGSGRSEQSLCPTLAGTLNAIEGEGLDAVTEDERSRQAFVACRAELTAAGVDLEAYTSSATVADIEAIRQALGVSTWNIYSVSYGSLVAMHAMRTYPDRIRSVILSSPYPPNSVTWAEQASSAAGAYAAIDRACAERSECREQFGDLVGKLEATLTRLEREPLRDGDALITGRQFASALWPLAVNSTTNRFVPLAISRAYDGDADLIRKLVKAFAGGDSFGGYSPAQAFAISCHESGRTREMYARAQALYPSLVSAAPAEGWDLMCAAFHPGFADPSFFAPVASEIPTLIYAGSLDPATPVVDAYQAMRFLSHATLVEIEGAAHSPIGLDDCTRGIALAFLDRPDRAPDVTCISAREPIRFASEGLDELLEEFAS